jgi:tRNA-dihydrouridine synthase A
MTNAPYISVAPMMDWTDRHCRYFHRLIAPSVRLYTEMVTTGALIHGDAARYLQFNEQEHPVALQLGGCDPSDLAHCARLGEEWGYDEINLNCGCPSPRVQKGRFGACLMEEPEVVAASVAAMAGCVSIPVTVKCRIGIDNSEDYTFLERFVRIVSEAGCGTFIIHARKAWLEGLSPKENREVPPLRYDIVRAIKAEFPHLSIILNGGLSSVEAVVEETKTLDGAMIGRAAYQDPYLLNAFETSFYRTPNLLTREGAALAMIPYIEQQNRDYGVPVKSITRHMLGLFQDVRGARAWRRILSEGAAAPDTTADIVLSALDAVTSPRLAA